jgi:hypothetical protein
MAQPTDTTNGTPTVPTQQPTPAPCPDWCDTHHTVGAHDRTVVHEGAPTAPIDTFDADFTARPVLYHGPDDISTEVALTIREHGPDDRITLLGMSIPDALRLINGLLDVVNLTLPVEEQQLLGPPGFEYVPYGADDLGWV